MDYRKINKTAKNLAKKGVGKPSKCERYSTMFNEINDIIDVAVQNKTAAICLASNHGNFLVNHIFRLNPNATRYAFYAQYKQNQFQLNSVLTSEGGEKVFVKWFPNDWYTQEVTSIIIPEASKLQHFFKTYSIFSFPRTCLELTFSNSSGIGFLLNQKLNDHYSLGAECYCDVLSNNKVHYAISGSYNDQLRKAIMTITGKSSIYLFYLRRVNANVNLAAEWNAFALTSQEQRSLTTRIGASFKLPRTKAEIGMMMGMEGTAKIVLKEKLTSQATMSFSAEINPFFDSYSFGMSFVYGMQVDTHMLFSPLGSQS